MTGTGGAFTSATGRSLEEGGADKPRYRRYQYDLIAPHCGRSVLEVGAGLGEFASQFTGLDRLVVTDVDPDAVTLLKSRIPGAEASQFDLAARRWPSTCWSTSKTTLGCCRCWPSRWCRAGRSWSGCRLTRLCSVSSTAGSGTSAATPRRPCARPLTGLGSRLR